MVPIESPWALSYMTFVKSNIVSLTVRPQITRRPPNQLKTATTCVAVFCQQELKRKPITSGVRFVVDCCGSLQDLLSNKPTTIHNKSNQVEYKLKLAENYVAWPTNANFDRIECKLSRLFHMSLIIVMIASDSCLMLDYVRVINFRIIIIYYQYQYYYYYYFFISSGISRKGLLVQWLSVLI